MHTFVSHAGGCGRHSTMLLFNSMQAFHQTAVSDRTQESVPCWKDLSGTKDHTWPGRGDVKWLRLIHIATTTSPRISSDADEASPPNVMKGWAALYSSKMSK